MQTFSISQSAHSSRPTFTTETSSVTSTTKKMNKSRYSGLSNMASSVTDHRLFLQAITQPVSQNRNLLN
uniref:Uncharacterized protein n=2 Tax=Anguilla anguilla TaxID=7936 RepID=A0A0E9R7X9_ANGAN